MNQNLSDNLSQAVLNEDSFANIFQPMSEEEFIRRKLKNCTKNPDGTYSCEGDVSLSSMDLEKLPVRFKEVKGNFWCYTNNLTSLEGAPEKAGGCFYCTHNKLTSLEGAPEVVGGDFWCNNNNLTSLEGAPEEVGGCFYCNNNELTSLEGAPEEVRGSFYCYNNPLPEEELKKTVDRDYLG